MNWKIESAITVHFDALFSSCSVCSTVFNTERYRKIRCETLASETQTTTWRKVPTCGSYCASCEIFICPKNATRVENWKFLV